MPIFARRHDDVEMVRHEDRGQHGPVTNLSNSAFERSEDCFACQDRLSVLNANCDKIND